MFNEGEIELARVRFLNGIEYPSQRNKRGQIIQILPVHSTSQKVNLCHVNSLDPQRLAESLMDERSKLLEFLVRSTQYSLSA
jgi:hypothetical protein